MLRSMDKINALKELELFRLELAKKFLNTEFLEVRIQGIRELNSIVEGNKAKDSNRILTVEFIVTWMIENDVFDTIWDARKTHQSIVERSDKIYTILLE